MDCAENRFLRQYLKMGKGMKRRWVARASVGRSADVSVDKRHKTTQLKRRQLRG